MRNLLQSYIHYLIQGIFCTLTDTVHMAQVFITSNIMIISLYLNRLLLPRSYFYFSFVCTKRYTKMRFKDSNTNLHTHKKNTTRWFAFCKAVFFLNVICLKDNDGFHTFFVAKNIQIVVFSRNTNYPVISISRNTLSRIFKRKANSLQTTM